MLAELRRLKSLAFQNMGLCYLGGLTKAIETPVCFIPMCLWPTCFVPLALGFATVFSIRVLAQLHAGWLEFGEVG